MISFYAFGRAGLALLWRSFPAAFRLNIYCCFLVTLCVMNDTIFTFLVISDARRQANGFRLSARRLFGVGAIVLSKIIRPGKSAAVAGMVSGMTVANLVGIRSALT